MTCIVRQCLPCEDRVTWSDVHVCVECQVVYLEAQGDGAVFASLTNGPHPLYVPLIMLVLDCILYLLLAVYLDQVLPGNYTFIEY